MRRRVHLLLPLGLVLWVVSACGVTSDLGGDVPTAVAFEEDSGGGLDASDAAVDAATAD